MTNLTRMIFLLGCSGRLLALGDHEFDHHVADPHLDRAALAVLVPVPLVHGPSPRLDAIIPLLEVHVVADADEDEAGAPERHAHIRSLLEVVSLLEYDPVDFAEHKLLAVLSPVDQNVVADSWNEHVPTMFELFGIGVAQQPPVAVVDDLNDPYDSAH